MYRIFRTKKFKKDYKKLSDTDKDLLKKVIILLTNGNKIGLKYKDHKLIGNFLNCRECHIKPNLLLIYRIYDDTLELALVRTGRHSKLFQ